MDLNWRARPTLHLVLAVAPTLAVIAALAPSPWYLTERDVYQRIGRAFFIRDCSSLHCTRALMSWILEQLPGPSLLKWKMYAVAGGTMASAGAAQLGRQLGLTTRAGRWSAWLVALGAGVQITLFDPYGSDPFIYAITPWMIYWVVQRRVALAASLAMVGVFAKEFAAAPLWIGVGYAILGRRHDLLWRCAAAAMAATLVWIILQIVVILAFNNSYGGSPSALVFEGGNFVRWFRLLGPVQSLGALALHVVPLVALAAAAYRGAPRTLQQLAIASIPAGVVLVYVQQPDRAVWNFQPVLAPLAALQLESAAPAFVWVFLAGYVSANLRVAPQIAGLLSPAAFVVGIIGAIGVIVTSVSRDGTTQSSDRQTDASDPRVTDRLPVARASARARVTALATGAALALALLMAGDIFVHRRRESDAGVNIWGYRGPVVRQKAQDEIRVIVLGGSTAFGRELTGSMPSYLQDYLNNVRLRGDASFHSTSPVTVLNLATPYDHVGAFEATLEDYAWLGDDVVCLYIGHDDPAPSPEAARSGWRRQSAVFRTAGYLPVLPSLVWPRSALAMDVHENTDDDLAALDRAIARVLASGRRVIVATHPFLTADEGRRQDILAVRLRDRFDQNSQGSYLDLRRTVTSNDPKLVTDGIHPTPLGNSVIAESLSQSVFRLLERDR
jgi:hypothetical protein